MNYVFYSLPKDSGPGPAPELPPGYEAVLWRPGLIRLAPSGDSLQPVYVFWWLLHHLRVFSGRGYAVLIIRHGGRIVHRSCVLPYHVRLPFMERDDLFVGNVWTDPAHRGRGLATYALQYVVHHLRRKSGKVWYVVGEDNAPSVRVAEKAGFVRVGEGQRKECLGLGFLGTYVITRRPAP
jgi:RimJ/RimL family protein N-acetyltransferase